MLSNPSCAFACVLLTLAACASTPVAENSAVSAAVGRMWKEHIAAAQRKDLDATLAMYADDVVYVIPGAQDVRGRAALEVVEAEALRTADIFDVVHSTHDLHVFGDVAYEVGTVHGPVRPHGQPVRVVTFHFMAQWDRQVDGTWRVRCLVGR